MLATKSLRRNHCLVLYMVPLTVIAALIIGAWVRVGFRFRSQSQSVGMPRLVRVEPLSAGDGVQCEWQPASTTVLLSENPASEAMREPASNAGPAADTSGSVEIDRSPSRVIRDTYPTYSAVALDTNTQEVYLQDENLFGYRVFNRMDNTPRTAEFTEPKRIVGGLKTELEFNCALYVDQKSGDVYSVNNDTVDKMVVFPRDAKGNVAPARELHIPHGSYGIAVNEEAQELFLTVEHLHAVMVYRKNAAGEEKPLRSIRGDHTGLADPHGIAVDTTHKLLFVTNHGSTQSSTPLRSGRFEPPSITVYPLDASGDIAPLRTIQGPHTELNWPAHLYVDTDHGELFVANDAADSVLVFRETDSGDAAPARAIRGPKPGLKNPTGLFLDPKNDELWVSNMGNHSARVFARTADGDTAPLRVIRSAPEGKMALAIGNPGATAYDSKRNEVLVPN